MRLVIACLMLLGLAAPAQAACVTYVPDLAAFPIRTPIKLRHSVLWTAPSGTTSTWASTYFDDDLTWSPMDVAIATFGRDNVPPVFQGCDGVYSSASQTDTERITNPPYVVTRSFSAVDGVITFRIEGTETGCSWSGASDCSSYEHHYVEITVYEVRSGRLSKTINSETRWSGVSADATRYDAVILGEGASTTDIPIVGGAELPPVFPMTVTSNISEVADVRATIGYRPQDLGSTRSVYVFAVAPATLVRGAMQSKDGPACVIAQLGTDGQLHAASESSLRAYSTGVLTAQGQSVTLLDQVPTANVAGATLYVGYGTTSAEMIDSGVNRRAVTIPGGVQCRPEAPQTGWWWNPQEDGRGFSVEVRGSNLFFAAFLYDVSGRSTWYVSTGPVSLDGSRYRGALLAARNGQTLGGEYAGLPTLSTAGTLTLAFESATRGTLTWPGGTVPIERFNIVPNGLGAPPAPNQPESGWWWNEEESGRGFFLEWQGGTLDIAGYMYDDAGNPVWYLTVDRMTSQGGNTFSQSWWSYGNGQTLTGAWRPHSRLSSNVAPVTITFDGPTTATMTLPNARTTRLSRHRF